MIFLRFRDILLLILYPKIAYKGISANTRGHCVIMVLSGWTVVEIIKISGAILKYSRTWL
jgi:ABC-type Mn2+/Zn2+ transport system permease subunit